MLRFSGFLKNVSIVFLTITLLTVYAFLGHRAGILFDKNGNVIVTLTKNQFFYFAFFIALGINILFTLFKSVYFRNKQDKSGGAFRNRVHTVMVIWWHFLIMSANLFLMSYVIFAGLANNAENYSFYSVTFIPVVGIGPLLITLIALPFLYFTGIKKLRGSTA